MSRTPRSRSSAKYKRGLLAIGFFLSSVFVQAQTGRLTGRIEGTITDSQSRPVPGASVNLRSPQGEQQSTHSDQHGLYRFSGLANGKYEIRAEMSGIGASAAICSIDSNDPKQVNLLLSPATSAFEFSVDPKFTVSGVTDASSAGSHGSSASAPTTEALARATVALGKETSDSPDRLLDEKALRAAADKRPDDFSANRDAGVALVRAEKLQDALPYLHRASQLFASNPEQAAVHRLLGKVSEGLNEPLEAVREYQEAAKLDASEENLFDWGSELLLHRGIGPSIEVFKKAHDLYPKSARTLLGLAAAHYSQASYEQAAGYVVEASDLNPVDTNPYIFMGEMVSTVAVASSAISNRLARFAELQPENAQANYFYALSLWKHDGHGLVPAERSKVRSLLEKAIRIDPRYAAAYVELGIVRSDEGDVRGAISAYRRAVELDPKLPEAHYRLALAYKRSGENDHAEEELRLYKESSNAVALESNRERRAIQQFVFTLQESAVTAPK